MGLYHVIRWVNMEKRTKPSITDTCKVHINTCILTHIEILTYRKGAFIIYAMNKTVICLLSPLR